ncbi:bifunctional phosphopantothenoylcysteine decarboxylase/phosphopantothenate--cysteine ligase CoaBC [Salsipaludibacter albus]|uniref:bifunctional phosphopantothenoylcysteine decarboxylase/phosphopantothenate--cysteine ligase CoaBC n=1 Tax=Salsipaludibacter albus TaxID=2849650 RepID=UPI001EE4BA0E|nr:bifunctional phosphopantothenoylcysteine decarboxylase/phosphopantothenate--cysteine ligase CoaBC [Salsipaludibacter albus]MBY5164022.1 bifunctional phosphopantothenoylcysteine decarboxylase/phosphopantothenate--cysteine ligase CoaBC [Salsipaludibacter albus]
MRNRRIVIGVTGGIAAYKAPLVVRRLVAAGADVDVVLTRGGARFVGAATFEGLTGRAVRSEVWDAVEEETHVALARHADVVAVYPATAHTMARAASGLADDLLTTTLLATTAPVVMAPAMHTEMWEHPATRANAAVLRERGVALVGPAEGALMGGDVGAGRAVEPDAFVAAVVAALGQDRETPVGGVPDLEVVADPDEQPWAGRRVVVTAGGTREPIDPVRWLGNRSTGRMGIAIAAAAARRGADVDLVIAGSELPTPPGVTRVEVTTASEMHEQVLARADADVVVKAAAVADFRPADVAQRKLKKADGTPTLSLVPNPDILADLGRRRAEGGGGPTVLVGFAAETDDPVANGRDKLARKQADLLVVNDLTATGAGFGHDTNEVVILAADGSRTDVALTSKDEVADRLLDVVDVRLAAADPAPSREPAPGR